MPEIAMTPDATRKFAHRVHYHKCRSDASIAETAHAVDVRVFQNVLNYPMSDTEAQMWSMAAVAGGCFTMFGCVYIKRKWVQHHDGRASMGLEFSNTY